jgi:hypothetical protein
VPPNFITITEDIAAQDIRPDASRPPRGQQPPELSLRACG